MSKNNKQDAKEILNESYIGPNEINDEETEINNIFTDTIHPTYNSTKNVNPAILYEKMNIQNTLIIPKNDRSLCCFSCQSLISKLNIETPTNLSRFLNFDLNEEIINENNHDLILPKESSNNPINNNQIIPFLDHGGKYLNI